MAELLILSVLLSGIVTIIWVPSSTLTAAA
jgi:hypothetical protein